MPTSIPNITLAVSLISLAASVSARETAAESVAALQLRETRLELQATLDYGEGSLEGRAVLTVENRSEHPAAAVPLNLGRLMTVHRVTGADGSPLGFEQDVVTFADHPTLQVRHVAVDLPSVLKPGANTTLTIDYSGWVVPYTETGSLYVRDRLAEEFSILRADAYAFPVVGLPSWEANTSIPWPHFDFRAAITVPERFTVASGGRLVERKVADGLVTWVYESVAPAGFLVLPIAEYTLVEEGGVRVFAFPQDVAAAERIVSQTHRAFELLAKWLGPLGGPAEIAVMELPDDWGSQASLTGGIIQTASAFRDPEAVVELYHEISHLWNAPDTDAPSARWNEGLATFLQYKLARAIDGRESMEETVEARAERLLAFIAKTPRCQGVPFAAYGEHRLTDLSYATGLVMFYLLDELAGTEALLAGLRTHYQAHRRSGGTFEDLVGHLKAASPVDLEVFFEDWVTTARWQERLSSAGSVAAMLASYRGKYAAR